MPSHTQIGAAGRELGIAVARRLREDPAQLDVGIRKIVNIQPRGSKAKAYQVKQVRNLLLKYKLVNPDES